MEIRKSTTADIARMLEIYASARRYMVASGNLTQWKNGYPARELLEADIAAGNSYVCTKSGAVCGTFAFIKGADPTYAEIEGGAWLNDKPYGTIHRIAADGSAHGVFSCCLEFCRAQSDEIRADTHADNLTMQHLLEKHGFVRCGIIYIADGTPRIAYHLSL